MTSFEPPAPPRRTRALAVLLVLLGLLAAGVTYTFARGAPEPASSASDTTANADLAPVMELYNKLTEDAVEAPDRESLIDGAIQGMLDEVDDPYASYFAPDEFGEFNQALDGRFTGVGLLLEDTPQGPVIVSVLEDTPAQEAGIQEGERIVSVDGDDVRDDALEEIVERVKGESGTQVRLGLEGGDQGARELTITRAEFDFPQTETRTLEDGVGYLSLRQFSDDAGNAVRDAVAEFVEDGAPGMILDLRRNPGGLLSQAVSVASVFIDDGTVVSVEERGSEREDLNARGDAFEDLPLVVLIDGNSASASEIVAGAIQAYDRGPLVGDTTFGKGTVQTITELSDGSGVKFTTARYFTPEGESIEGSGVAPDVKVIDNDEGEPDLQLEAAVEELQALVASS